MDDMAWTIAQKGGERAWPLEFWRPQFSYPRELGRGGVKMLCTRAGVALYTSEAALLHSAVLHVSDRRLNEERSALNFIYAVKGDISVHPEGFRRPFGVGSGQIAVYSVPESAGRFDFPASYQHLLPGGFSLGLLQNLADGLELPHRLRPLLDGGAARPLALTFQVDHHLELIIRDLYHHPYTGTAARLFQEAKGLELVAHLSQVWTERKVQRHQCWTRRDINRLHEARLRLLADLEEAPPLLDLARQVGLSPTKLKRGFREVFGTTVSDTLREARLQSARRLLAEGDLPLKTIALQVGFCDAASLSHAFKARFGTTPGKLRQR